MPISPSIKGTVFIHVVEELQRLLAEGAVSRDGLAQWLRPEDVYALAERPLPSGWYPIERYARMNELLRDVAGGGQDEYLRDLGRRTAQHFRASGRYQQIGYALRMALEGAHTPEKRFEAFGYDLPLFVSLSSNILNFSRWTVRADPDELLRYRVDVTEARALPDVFCWRTDGFFNELAAAHGYPGLWRWERVGPDVIVFRMNQSL
jgi:hypothetical protein